MSSASVCSTKSSRHAVSRAVERLKLPSAELEKMLTDDAFVVIQRKRYPTRREARLLWSPVDQTHVVAWVGVDDGQCIITCMPLAMVKDEFVEVRGKRAMAALKEAAKSKAIFWMVKTGSRQEGPADALVQAVQSVEAPKGPPGALVESPWKLRIFLQTVDKQYTLPIRALPRAFLAGTRIEFRRDILAFLQRMLETDGAVRAIEEVLWRQRSKLERLKSIGCHLLSPDGRMQRPVSLESTEFECDVEDLRMALAGQDLASEGVFFDFVPKAVPTKRATPRPKKESQQAWFPEVLRFAAGGAAQPA